MTVREHLHNVSGKGFGYLPDSAIVTPRKGYGPYLTIGDLRMECVPPTKEGEGLAVLSYDARTLTQKVTFVDADGVMHVGNVTWVATSEPPIAGTTLPAVL